MILKLVLTLLFVTFRQNLDDIMKYEEPQHVMMTVPGSKEVRRLSNIWFDYLDLWVAFNKVLTKLVVTYSLY